MNKLDQFSNIDESKIQTLISLQLLSYCFSNHSGKYDLSKREQECLFYILRGKTAKQIARILGLSYRTIQFYIENIKNKFVCRSKSELIAKAIEEGYFK